ncbi:hypothetical protein D3C78_1850500 [compost metagenome]
MRWMLALIFTVPVVAQAADASSCYTIANADQRAWCLAKAHNNPGLCYSAQDQAVRAQCLAEVRR